MGLCARDNDDDDDSQLWRCHAVRCSHSYQVRRGRLMGRGSEFGITAPIEGVEEDERL